MRPILILMISFISMPTFAFEKTNCVGTEPYWNLVLDIDGAKFRLDLAGEVFSQMRYIPAFGSTKNNAVEFNASNNSSTLNGFVTETLNQPVVDSAGKVIRTGAKAYCNNARSNLLYSLAVQFRLGRQVFTGCCFNAKLPWIK